MSVRTALRPLRNSARFTWTVIATLALGIGVSAAAVSIVEQVVLAPLPYPEPDELVVIWQDHTGVGGPPRGRMSRATYRELETLPSLSSVDAQFTYYANIGEATLDRAVLAARVTPGFLDRLGVQPLLGRTIRQDDRDAVVLSYHLWHSYFGGRDGVIGLSFRLEDVNPLREPGLTRSETFTVVGVMPPDLWAPALFSSVRTETDLWIAFHGEEDAPNENTTVLHIYGRLARGASLPDVQAGLDRITEAARQADPGHWTGTRLWVTGLAENHLGEARMRILLIGGAGLALLLLVLTNAGSLVLSRGILRAPEYSVRNALGASSGQLQRMALLENAVPVAIASGLGVAVAHLLVRLFEAYAPANTPRLSTLSLNTPALAFVLAVAVLSVLLLSAAILAGRSRTDVFGAIRRSRGSERTERLHSIGVVVQTALTVLLLVGMALAVQALRNMTGVDAVADVDNRLTLRLALPPLRYPDAVDRVRVVTEIHRAISDLPGVRASGSADEIPPVQGGGGGPFVSDMTQDTLLVGVRTVTLGYLDAIGLAVVDGRAFEASDDMSSARVAIVSRATAQALWPGTSPVGRVVRSADGTMSPTVVGVVPDLPSLLLDTRPRAELYVLHEQVPWGQHRVVIHVAGDPLDYLEAVRAAIRSVDPDLPVSDIASHRDLFAQAAAIPRFLGGLLSLLTAAALFLAAVGTIGVVSQVTSSRKREIAIRIATGATPADITGHFALRSLAVVAAGAVIGAFTAVPAGRLLASQLYGVGGVQPGMLALGIGTVTIVTLGATLPVLLRAGRTNPSSILRSPG